jgi:hypothetical protein
VLPAAVLVGASALRPIGDNSFLWHVRAGALQLEAGEVLRTDPFSFTNAGEAWRTQSWLAELAYGALERATGGLAWVGPMIALIGLITLAFAGLAVYARVRSIRPVTVSVSVLALGFLYFSVPRPVLVSFALLAVLMVVLAQSERLAWALVPLLWLWALLHATWVIALAVVALEIVRRRSKKLFLAGAMAGVVTLLTPHGIEMWRFALDLSRDREALAYLSEWQPPDFTSAVLWPFLVMLIGLLVAAVKGKLSSWDLPVVIPILLLGLLQERTVFVALLLLLPYAAEAIPQSTRAADSDREAPVMNWLIAGTVAVGLFGVFFSAEVEFSKKFPAELADRLEADAVFHGVGVGGYLIYANGPDRPVYVDDRAELYGEPGFKEFTNAVRGVGYREVFERWGITEALAEKDWPLVVDLVEDGWLEVATEHDFVLLRAP